jgi:hypothetical protein
MRYRPQKSALPLTAADRVKIERLLLSPIMQTERKEFEQILHAGNSDSRTRIARETLYEQWPFY